MADSQSLARTPLHALHEALSARMVPFAGYEMPVQYPTGVLREHLHTREHAGLFDVSHMGQVRLSSRDGVETAAARLETLVCADILSLVPGRQRYALFTNDDGGIVDDLMVANLGDALLLVVNAARKEADFAHLRAQLDEGVELTLLDDRALLALQGPKAVDALTDLGADVADMRFMDVREIILLDTAVLATRSGYTGEDGFELSLPASAATTLAEALLDDERVEAVGLGARDSLRLEAGLCLHGSDIDADTTPIEASLGWAIGRARRAGGVREGGFPGATRILAEQANGAARQRVGLLARGRAPVRAGAELFADETSGEPVGKITSGGFGPSVSAPVAMGYVESVHATTGTALHAEVRGKRLPVAVASLPFVPARFAR